MCNDLYRSVLLCLSLAVSNCCLAAERRRASDYLSKPTDWFSSQEGRRIADNIVSFQSVEGGWPKNTDTVSAPYSKDRKNLKPTFDNGSTTDELRFLAKSFAITQDDSARKSFELGLSYILNAQYPNGGWPQNYPLQSGYHRHITFNDNAMVRLMEFLREVYTGTQYSFMDSKSKETCRSAFDRGIQCILNCQIRLDGRRTVWCAQHHSETLEPVLARSYELPSFSGSESVGLVRLLISLENPTKETQDAIRGAVAWFKKSQLDGIRVVTKPDAQSEKGKDRVVIQDQSAPPLWARFYDLDTGKPMFCDRDGIPKNSLAEIGYERRNGYAWYGNWPQRLLEVEYPEWEKRL